MAKRKKRSIWTLASKILQNLGLLLQSFFQVLPKLLGIVVLNLILLASVFQWGNARLSNQTVSIAIMVLLLALFSDLKNFDFWGLKGTKKEKEEIQKTLEEASDEDALDPSSLPASGQQELIPHQGSQAQPIYLMGDLKANFLQISFDLERLLRQAATRVTDGQVSPNMTAQNITKILVDKGVVTASGKEQLDAIRKIRNLLVHGRDEELNEHILRTGLDLAYGIYTELTNLLDAPIT